MESVNVKVHQFQGNIYQHMFVNSTTRERRKSRAGARERSNLMVGLRKAGSKARQGAQVRQCTIRTVLHTKISYFTMCAGAAVVRNLLGSLPTSIWLLLLLPPNISMLLLPPNISTNMLLAPASKYFHQPTVMAFDAGADTALMSVC